MYKDKKLNLVIEFIDGGTLKDLLHDTSKPLTNIKKVNMAKDISSGMVSKNKRGCKRERETERERDLEIYNNS